MFVGPSLIDANCHGDFCQGNIFPGDICPYQGYLSCYCLKLNQTLEVSWQSRGKVEARSRQGHGKVKARSRQEVEARPGQQGKVRTRSEQGQSKVKERSKQGQGNVKVT